MIEFLGFVIQGGLIGVAYGLIALPFGLAYQTVHVADAAVGSYATLAGIVAVSVGGVVGAALGLLAGIAMALLVGLIYQLLIKRGIGDPIIVVAATFAVALAVESVILTQYGKDAVIERIFTKSWDVGGIYIYPQSVINLVIGLLLVGALVAALSWTSAGRQIRASADNVLGALLAGIPVVRLRYVVFATEGLLAGIGGVLLSYTTGLDYASGIRLTLTAFGAAIIFGLRGPLPSFLGGIVIGVVQAVVAGYTSGGVYAAIPFIFVLAVLVASPRVVTAGRP